MEFKENYNGKTISLEIPDVKINDFYANWGSQFESELLGAVKAGIDGEDSELLLWQSLECFGLSSSQKHQLAALLPFFVVRDQKKIFDISFLKKALVFPHFELPHFLKEDKKRIVGLAVGCTLLLSVSLTAAINYFFRENPKKIALANETEVAPKVEPTTVPTAPPSRFQDLMVGDGEAASPVVNSSPTVMTEVEPTIENQHGVAVGENEIAPTKVSAYAIRQLIVNDDETTLRSLFVGQKLLIEADGFCSHYISEQCTNLIGSGNIKLVFDNATPSLLKKIVIN